MAINIIRFLKIALLFLCIQANGQVKPWSENLITIPEKSNYQKTSTYADVMHFIEAIKSKSDLVHLEFMGKSKEGKDIPLIIMANPKISSPKEAKDSGKPIMYVQGNIHAGEVEGKEVLQQLMRDILLGKKKHLLDNQIIIFAPIYNTDSNDKMKKGRRPSQEDSPVEVGIRANSQGLDLNRDGIKMEAFETQGLIQNVLLKWDPEMLVDLHTTNGTWHGYGVTYAPSYHYAGEKAPYDFTWNTMLPSIVKSIDKNYGVKLGPYGGYSLRQGWPTKAIYTYNHHPRYIVNQMGLRNKVGILSEAFAHDRFYKRMDSTYGFVAEILEFTNINGRKMAAINAKAEQDAIANVKQNAGKIKKGVRYKMVPLEEKFTLRTYDYLPFVNEEGYTKHIRSGKIIEIPNVENYSKFEAKVSSTLPRGYFLPKAMKQIADHLKKQGVEVIELKKSKRAVGEVFVVKSLKNASRKFEGHYMAILEGEFVPKTRTFKKGDYWVDMAQPLSNLIFYMLEPQSDDGLVTWNFFDAYFKNKGISEKPVIYPVFKYYKLK
ncbi:MAG: M14 family metallopeptidase [Chlorobi bacterium]|nr:M14 family metallopeptidase [Chlorobiota bacterium]